MTVNLNEDDFKVKRAHSKIARTINTLFAVWVLIMLYIYVKLALLALTGVIK